MWLNVNVVLPCRALTSIEQELKAINQRINAPPTAVPKKLPTNDSRKKLHFPAKQADVHEEDDGTI